MRVEFTVAVEQDDIAKGKYMVVLRGNKDEVIGVPVRGTTKEKAYASLDLVRFSFEYGVKACEAAHQNINLAVTMYGGKGL